MKDDEYKVKFVGALEIVLNLQELKLLGFDMSYE